MVWTTLWWVAAYPASTSQDSGDFQSRSVPEFVMIAEVEEYVTILR
jgi:hypothetical protein